MNEVIPPPHDYLLTLCIGQYIHVLKFCVFVYVSVSVCTKFQEFLHSAES